MPIYSTAGDQRLKFHEDKVKAVPQRIVVFQQNGSGEKKIAALRTRNDGLMELEIVSIDSPLPPILDESDEYLPTELKADLVLDFLKHPDLSQDLAKLCQSLNIPIVASGKKHRVRWAIAPPT